MNNYRECATIVLFNDEGKVLLCARADESDFAWQFPQGGIEKGENPENAALRELQEETSVTSAQIIFSLNEPLCYDFPQSVREFLASKGRHFIGQCMYWFLAHFTGDDSEINLATEQPEFKAYKWADISEAPKAIIDFKRATYLKACHAFEPYIKAYVNNINT